jgi:hypothetical protein
MPKSARVRSDSRARPMRWASPQIVRASRYTSGETDFVRVQDPPC